MRKALGGRSKKRRSSLPAVQDRYIQKVKHTVENMEGTAKQDYLAEALIRIPLTVAGLTAADVATGSMSAADLAKLTHTLPMLVEGWAAGGWIKPEAGQYPSESLPLIEAMLEITSLVAPEVYEPVGATGVSADRQAWVRQALASLADRMREMWAHTLMGQRPLVKLNLPDGQVVELHFLERALADLQDVTVA